ncbi:MAG: PQQ-binding-like beta-propeller repeat protein [Bacteroidetes bacterium]|nr:PQQ-binding-like beta-propeller repeat protein [Bacteroidota bacterium]MDA1119780.1 PQQ-binding-like beta-propeller repeat protein [Bacteroidota bacterium]
MGSYLGDKSVSHYSQLDQINKENVNRLKQAWIYDGGKTSTNNRTQIQCNPLIIDGVLFGTTALLKLFALNAATGEQLWQFDPNKDSVIANATNRGLAVWQEQNDQRLFYAIGEYLFAIDPSTGQLISSFGEDGRINLKNGLGREVDNLFFSANSQGIIYNDLYIIGGKVSETTGHVPGHIRAYDVRTGDMKWIFHTIPHPGEYGYETWPEEAYQKSGGANVWSGFSLDEERGIVYAPTGSPSFDFYGGDRIGSNLFANSIIGLDAKTGKRIWHYQTVHHDLFDYDLPAPPNLVTIEKDGEKIDAIVQISKMGYLYVLNRVTGEPIYPIIEAEVPASDLEGEESWPTQPIPSVYPPFSRTLLTEEDLAIRSEEASAYAKELWQKNRKGRPFIPPSLQSSILFPGMNGGGEWGGAAIDPNTNVLYVNSNESSYQIKVSEFKTSTPGEGVYKTKCQSCHGAGREGGNMFGNVPSLIHVTDSLTKSEMINTITNGKGIMPSFGSLEAHEIESVVNFLRGIETDTVKTTKQNWPYPYIYDGYKIDKAPDNLPFFKPPWGQLTAIDLNSAEKKWQIPLGDIDSLNIPGHQITGTLNYGGPVVTAGGVLFIAATIDAKFRAFDKDTGDLLWEAALPNAGFATPATYYVDGIQYVVVACGGGKGGLKSGDSYVSFALGDD